MNIRTCLSSLALVLVLSSLSLAADPPAKAPSDGPAKAPAAAKPSPDWAKTDLKAGIIGCDTSHVPAFAGVFGSNPQWRLRVTAAFPGGSPDMPQASMGRVEGYVKTLRQKHQVKIVDSIEDLLKEVDVVLIESVDGRPHLAQARPVIAAGKPLFIDKPFTAGLADAKEIVRLAGQARVPFFSCSCVRFQPEIARFRQDADVGKPDVGKLTKAVCSSPLHLEPHHPDLFWYGVHGVEALYTVMGRGCVSLKRGVEGDADITTGAWSDGRVGVFRGMIKGSYLPLVKVEGDKGQADSGKTGYSYVGLCETMAKFFHTRQSPIDPQETLEIIEFMTAAQLSKERGGAEVRLDELRR